MPRGLPNPHAALSIVSGNVMPTVFVISKDWTLRATLRAELREAGLEALGMESADDAAQAIAQGRAPSAIVLDAGEASTSAQAALSNLVRRVPTVLVASRTEGVALPEGAAALFYRPVRLGAIVAQVKKLLEGQAA